SRRCCRRSTMCLYYLAFSRTSTTRQRLVDDSGRVSINSTRSPTTAALASSCALSLLVRRMTLPYNGCLTRSSTATTTVLSILSLTTRPSRTLRSELRAVSAAVDASLLMRPLLQVLPTGRVHAHAGSCRSARCHGGRPAAGGCCPAARSPSGSAG